MTLTARVSLRSGRYEAGGPDNRWPESVPSPYRLFCALVSVAGREGDPATHAGLRWLEAQTPPVIVVPAVLDSGRNDTFHVTNRIESKGGSMSHPGRVNGAKHRAWVNFEGDGFQFAWQAEPDEFTLAALQRLAAGVTYVGRVESGAAVTFYISNGPTEPKHRVYRQVPLGQGSETIAAPYRGCTDALVDTFERGAPPWETARGVAYVLDRTPDPQPAPGPFDSVLVFRIAGQSVPSANVLDLAAAFRSAVMSRVGGLAGADAIPPEVHGHTRDPGHLAYLGLPFVGGTHGDGRVLGVAVALPSGIDPAVRELVSAALLDPHEPLEYLQYGRARGGRLELEFDAFPSVATLKAARWQANPSGSRWWATATPMMLDRYPGADGVEAAVAADVVRAGYPPPSAVEASPSGFLAGAARFRRGWSEAVGSRPRRPLWHARLQFDDPVVGPVLVGSLRFLGGGLFAPCDGWFRPVASDATAAARAGVG